MLTGAISSVQNLLFQQKLLPATSVCRLCLLENRVTEHILCESSSQFGLQRLFYWLCEEFCDFGFDLCLLAVVSIYV